GRRFDEAQDLLLVRPDDEPDVEGHDQRHPHADADHHEARTQRQRLDDVALHPREQQAGDHRGERGVAEVEEHVGRDELADRRAMLDRLDGRHGRHLHEVEVPQQADPQHATDHVQPAHDKGPVGVVGFDHLSGGQADDDDDGNDQHDPGDDGIPGRCEDGTHVRYPFYLVDGLGESPIAHCTRRSLCVQRAHVGVFRWMSDAYLAPAASHRYVLDLVRSADRDRFLGALFAPEPARSDLLALLAFNHELARTRSVTREPMLARIRLEWWREAVGEAAGTGKPRAQPVVESLSETVRRRRLRAQDLVALIDAREEEIEGPLDVLRAGHALADLELAVLGVGDAASRRAARGVAAAWLMGEGP